MTTTPTKPLEQQPTVQAIDHAIRVQDTASLAQLAPAIVGVPMMDAAEAREYLKMLRWDLEAADQALTNFRARALDFAEREGWKALGYAGAIEALQTELGAQYSKSYLSRILQAGEIERVLELPIGQLPERTLRPLGQLDSPEQQRQAFKAVEGKPTAAKVQQAVEQIKPPAPPAPAVPAETDDSAIIGTIRAKASALGLGVIWEDDTVILHWPEEDIEQLSGMGYAEALHWLATDGVQQAEARRAAAQPSAPARPAVPPRPRRPASADVSATMRYIDQLEAYCGALEAFIMALQRQSARGVPSLESEGIV